eukprot:1708825-Rhodomonas_salina.2
MSATTLRVNADQQQRASGKASETRAVFCLRARRAQRGFQGLGRVRGCETCPPSPRLGAANACVTRVEVVCWRRESACNSCRLSLEHRGQRLGARGSGSRVQDVGSTVGYKKPPGPRHTRSQARLGPDRAASPTIVAAQTIREHVQCQDGKHTSHRS